MKAMDVKNFPTAADLLATIEPRAIHIAITGLVALERVIDASIRESLPNAEEFPLDRVPFSQKLALTVALGTLKKTSLPAYKALNAIRNQFAHDLVLTLDRKIKRDLRNCLSPGQRKGLSRPQPTDSLACLREVIGILYSELRTAVEQRRERRLRAEAYNDITKESLMGANYGNAWIDIRRALEHELKKRVAAKKRALGWTYNSPSHAPRSWDPSEFDFIAPK